MKNLKNTESINVKTYMLDVLSLIWWIKTGTTLFYENSSWGQRQITKHLQICGFILQGADCKQWQKKSKIVIKNTQIK